MGNDHYTLVMTHSLYTHCHMGWICVLQTQFQLKLWNSVLKTKFHHITIWIEILFSKYNFKERVYEVCNSECVKKFTLQL